MSSLVHLEIAPLDLTMWPSNASAVGRLGSMGRQPSVMAPPTPVFKEQRTQQQVSALTHVQMSPMRPADFELYFCPAPSKQPVRHQSTHDGGKAQSDTKASIDCSKAESADGCSCWQAEAAAAASLCDLAKAFAGAVPRAPPRSAPPLLQPLKVHVSSEPSSEKSSTPTHKPAEGSSTPAGPSSARQHHHPFGKALRAAADLHSGVRSFFRFFGPAFGGPARVPTRSLRGCDNFPNLLQYPAVDALNEVYTFAVCWVAKTGAVPAGDTG